MKIVDHEVDFKQLVAILLTAFSLCTLCPPWLILALLTPTRSVRASRTLLLCVAAQPRVAVQNMSDVGCPARSPAQRVGRDAWVLVS